MPPLKSFEKLLKDAFPTLTPEFITHCLAFAENRRVAAFIVTFLAFNNLFDRLDGIVPYNHELFKHLEHSSAKPPPTAFDKLVKADFPKINEILEVLLCTYDSIVDLQTLALRNQFTCGICCERYTDDVAIYCGLETDLTSDAVITPKFCPNCIQNHTNLNAEEMPLLEDGAGLKFVHDVIVDLETLVLTHQFTCGICRERYSDNVAISCGQDTDVTPNGAGDAAVTHKFCHECIQVHTDLNAEEMPLLEGGAGLKCIEHECQRPIYISSIRSLLSKHVINRLDDRIQAESLAALGIHIERCEVCDYAVELEKPSETNKVFACPMCNKAKCRICQLDWDNEHFGVKCQVLVDKLKTEKKDKYMNGVYARMNEAASATNAKFNSSSKVVATG